MNKTVKEHQIRKDYICGKIYLPKDWIGKKVNVELE